tara:strand:+ start:1567 stop:2025 length:459 start_codon:yes stop_codon:yes gene_type:complete
MNFFKILLFIIFLLFNYSIAAFADNHAKTAEEIVNKAKEINEQIDQEEEVPLNDPFAGNEGTTSSNANIPEEEQQDQFSIYNYKLSGLISGTDHSYISLVDSSGEFTTLTLGQNLGKAKLIDLRLTEAIFQKEDKSYLIIDFNNIVREANEY